MSIRMGAANDLPSSNPLASKKSSTEYSPLRNWAYGPQIQYPAVCEKSVSIQAPVRGWLASLLARLANLIRGLFR